MILFVKFKSELTFEEVMEVAESRIEEFRALEGLTQKYYVRDPATGEIGGIYIWDSAASLAQYSKSELRATIAEAYKVKGTPRAEVLEVVEVLR